MAELDHPLNIVQIHNETPKLEITIGFDKVIRALNDIFSFRRRRQNADMREREGKLKDLEIELRQREVDIDISMMREKAEMELERERLKIIREIMHLRQQLLPEYLEQAEDHLRKHYPQLSDEERLKYAPEVASILLKSGLTDITMRFGWQNRPRPPTVPR